MSMVRQPIHAGILNTETWNPTAYIGQISIQEHIGPEELHEL